ncbi:ATP-binding protein [Massilia varians]
MGFTFDTMVGRVTALLVAGVVASATVTQVIAEAERLRAAEEARNVLVLNRSVQVLNEVKDIPPDQREAFLAATNKQGARLSLEKVSEPPVEPTAYARTLQARMGEGFKVRALASRAPECDRKLLQPTIFGRYNLRWEGICENLSVIMPDGDRIRISVVPPGMPRPENANYLLGILLFLISTVVLAYWIARMTVRPLDDLANAALRLGKDINQAPLPLDGAAEIRKASGALNTMQAMIREYIRQRTVMLAAITHDLQTPLTRMRFRLEKVENEELKEQLLGDLAAVLSMVREGLDLARSTDSVEPTQAMDLDSLLHSVCHDASESGQPVTVQGHSYSALIGRPQALRRCLNNLIDNAVKYGQEAVVSIERSGNQVFVRIRDCGPGIDEAELERVFDPFYRVESSRSRKSGGTGLGLTIARNIAAQHNGNVTLANLPGGGMEATLTLPASGSSGWQ